MATLSTSARNAACDAIVDLIDSGSTNSAGQIEFQTSANAEVATCAMSNPAFGSAASGTATANSITSDTSATGGTIDHVSIQDRDENEIMQCTIATDSSADFQISSLVISSGDTVGVSSLTVTVNA